MNHITGRCVTWDSQEESSDGDVWEFTTGINDDPTDPIINGTDRGGPGKEHEFTIVSTDPNNHSIRYYVNWDDGTHEYTDYYESGEVVTVNHTWEKAGNYVIK